jgi:hypothetical protein
MRVHDEGRRDTIADATSYGKGAQILMEIDPIITITALMLVAAIIIVWRF